MSKNAAATIAERWVGKEIPAQARFSVLQRRKSGRAKYIRHEGSWRESNIFQLTVADGDIPQVTADEEARAAGWRAEIGADRSQRRRRAQARTGWTSRRARAALGEPRLAPHALQAGVMLLGRRRYTPPPPGGGGGAFTRKPVIDTPAIPTTAVNRYVDFSLGNDSTGTGSSGAPFKTFAAAMAGATAGITFHLTGTLDNGGTTNEYFGMGGLTGSSIAPVVVRRWAGKSQPVLKLGYNLYEVPSVLFQTQAHWWFYDVEFQHQPTADGGRCFTAIDSDHIYTVSCRYTGGGPKYLRSTNCEIWDFIGTGDFGDIPANAGDFVAVFDGSHDFRAIRGDLSAVRSGHSAFLCVGISTDTVLRGEIFDVLISNPWAGGLQVLGGCENWKVHWNKITNVGTTPSATYPPGSREAFELASKNNTVEFNDIYSNGASGLSCQTLYYGGVLEQFASCTIRFNSIVNNAWVGLTITAAQGVNAPALITNNLFKNNLIWGNSTNPTEFTDGRTGYFSGVYYPIIFGMYNANSGNGGTPFADDQFYGTVFLNNCVGVNGSETFMVFLVRLTGNRTYTKAQVESLATGSGGNVFATNPNVVDVATNRRLQAGSPCIDAGAADAGFSFVGSAHDIGAFEYGGAD